MRTLLAVLKRLLVGRPISSHVEIRHRLSKRIALPVFASDALSSSAYATDAILLVLVLAGSDAIGLSIPISVAVTCVLGIVVISYQQTVRAYPSGGGAYIVASDNLGEVPGLVAASSLLIDYVLTVSVSVAAGVEAIGAAYPVVRTNGVGIALAVVAAVTLANLRGLKESGTLFAIPTYGFLATLGTMIVVGFVNVLSGNYEPIPHAAEAASPQALTLFLVLRAYASGSTALTGVEAISNGVPAFRPPEARNAARTLLVLGGLLAFLFVGLTFLANSYKVDPHAIEQGKTVTSQIAGAVFGAGSPLFLGVQIFTALILFLAANTSYADFPRLGSILAKDRYLPRVLQNRGDKLAFSNGIVILAIAAGAVLVNYRADVHRIIPLYVIGVFTSFTLSQTGMLIRWFKKKGSRWRTKAAVNGFGAVTTFIVLLIVATTRFTLGAWQVIILIPVLAWLLLRVNRHYRNVAEELRAARHVSPIVRNKVVLVVSPYIGANLKALSFVRAFVPDELHAVGFRVRERQLRDIRRRWKGLGISHPIEATGPRLKDLIEYVRDLQPSDATPVTVVLLDPQFRLRIKQLVKSRLLLRIKRTLLAEPGVVVISVPFQPGGEPEPERLRSPTRFSTLVVVSGVHLATLRALEYAKSLRPTELKALTIATDPSEAMTLLRDWQSWNVDVALEIVDSPFRSIIEPLIQQVHKLRPNPSDAVAVVVPEFVVRRWWHHLLHGQTAFLIKTVLLFEPNVIVIDVPYPVGMRNQRNGAGERETSSGKPRSRDDEVSETAQRGGEPART